MMMLSIWNTSSGCVQSLYLISLRMNSSGQVTISGGEVIYIRHMDRAERGGGPTFSLLVGYAWKLLYSSSQKQRYRVERYVVR